MTTLLISHPACVDHIVPQGHPERPERMRAVEEALAAEQFQDLAREQAPMADGEIVTLAHPMDYFEAIREASPSEGIVRIDSDTSMSPGSFEAALRCVGGAVLAVDEVMTGKVANAFVATRPPGHHAESDRAMGFCLFNNVAIAARALQHELGVDKILIIDWDVHHGNGTQHYFDEDPSVFYASTHQFPFYPGTGAVDEIGVGRGEGFTFNVPLPAGCGDHEYIGVMERLITPAAQSFRPEIILISCGFDAHRDDPLAQINLTQTAFDAMAADMKALAAECCGGKLVSILEGGYDYRRLSECAASHLALLQSDAG